MKKRDAPGWDSSARGESAWKEARARVAARNDEVRKAGKRERAEHDRELARRATAGRR